MGYTTVREYPGGKKEWAEAGLPLYASHHHHGTQPPAAEEIQAESI